MKKNSFSISSIPSEDIQNFKKKSSSSSSISSSNLSNSKNEKSEINENNLHSDRQLTTTNMNFNVENKKNNNEDNLNTISIFKENNKKEEEIMKKAENDFAKIGVVSAVYTSFCYWSNKYQKRKYELLKKAEAKIHYYLEIFNYIKGMQEIDLLKYCIFDQEQIALIDYLAKPPLKTNKKEITAIYKEFESEQVSFGKIGKKEIDEVFCAYNTIRNKDTITFEDLKLLRLINAEAQLLN